MKIPKKKKFGGGGGGVRLGWGGVRLDVNEELKFLIQNSKFILHSIQNI